MANFFDENESIGEKNGSPVISLNSEENAENEDDKSVSDWFIGNDRFVHIGVS
jgi:hypothetical protein